MMSYIDFLSFAAKFNRPKSINIFISIPLICSYKDRRKIMKNWHHSMCSQNIRTVIAGTPELSCAFLKSFKAPRFGDLRPARLKVKTF